MNQQAFDFNEFIDKKDPAPVAEKPAEETAAPELDVQKAVVESLAADKAEMDEKLRIKNSEIADKEADLARKSAELDGLKSENENLKSEITALKSELEVIKARESELEIKLAAEQSRQIDMQERNPNALALLDRDVEIPDRFPGETRDHVLEVIKEARDKAEADGRVRRAQVLESVLVANEPNGGLARRRAELEKLFVDNGNLVNGPVIAELERLGIPHKHGEEYLLPSEIIKRTY